MGETRREVLIGRMRVAGWLGLCAGVASALVLGAMGLERRTVKPASGQALPVPRILAAHIPGGADPAAATPDERPWALPAGEIDPDFASEQGGVLRQTLSDGAVVTFTLEPKLQQTAKRSLENYKVEQGAVVAVDPRTGEVLVYSEHAHGLPSRAHFPLVAEGPAASLFKMISAAAFLEKAGLTPSSEICTHGGLRKLTRANLKNHPRRDTRCDTLARAFGTSRNVAFARWADRLLEPRDLQEMAERFLFNRELPFLWATGTSEALFPSSGTRLDLARAAAGFQGTTLSPLHASLLAATVANAGTMMAPRIVASVDHDGERLYEADRAPLAQPITPKTAADLTTLMRETVTSGTARKFFAGRKRLEGVDVAGKTGHLAATIDGRPVHYSWFMAFAPAERPEIAVASVVVLGEQWTVKGVVPARDVLEAWARIQVSAARVDP